MIACKLLCYPCTHAVPMHTAHCAQCVPPLHSQCAHMMAMAVQRMYKDAQVTIGPWIDRGFYYDFDLKTPLSDKDLKGIKKEMVKISKAKLPFIREEVCGCRAGVRAVVSGYPYPYTPTPLPAPLHPFPVYNAHPTPKREQEGGG